MTSQGSEGNDSGYLGDLTTLKNNKNNYNNNMNNNNNKHRETLEKQADMNNYRKTKELPKNTSIEEEGRINDTGQSTSTQEPTQSYSDITTANSIFKGELTITSSIRDVQNFNCNQFCMDFAKKQPEAWKHVSGVQPVNSKVIEISFDSLEAMQHIQITGLDTHTKHLTFIPDQPIITTISLWNIPLELPSEMVDDFMARYGTVEHSYRSKKMIAGRNVLTGVRVYFMILEHAIPRFIEIGGRQTKTKYTGQEQHLTK